MVSVPVAFNVIDASALMSIVADSIEMLVLLLMLMLPVDDWMLMRLPLSSVIVNPVGIEPHLARVVLQMNVDAALCAVVEDDSVTAARPDHAEVVAAHWSSSPAAGPRPFQRHPIT